MIVLFAHVRTGKWASIMPAKLAETLGLTDNVRAIPIVEPAATHAVGLVVPHREPMTPLIAALVSEARNLASSLSPPPSGISKLPTVRPARGGKRSTKNS
jgi:DNA-binding transcriptional LysR family regulator